MRARMQPYSQHAHSFSPLQNDERIHFGWVPLHQHMLLLSCHYQLLLSLSPLPLELLVVPRRRQAETSGSARGWHRVAALSIPATVMAPAASLSAGAMHVAMASVSDIIDVRRVYFWLVVLRFLLSFAASYVLLLSLFFTLLHSCWSDDTTVVVVIVSRTLTIRSALTLDACLLVSSLTPQSATLVTIICVQ